MSGSGRCFCGEPVVSEFSVAQTQGWGATGHAIVTLCPYGHASCDLPLGHPFLAEAIHRAKEAFARQQGVG